MSTTNLALYPSFQHYSIKDRELLKVYLHDFPHYSDYDPTSLFTWDTEDELELSMSGRNLVVVFQDYETTDKFFSFIGQDKVAKCANDLIGLSLSRGYGDTLRLIPQVVIDHLEDKTNFIIEEDRDNFDYILSVDLLANLVGSKNEDRRYQIKKFLKLYQQDLNVRPIDISISSGKAEIEECFSGWEKRRGETPEDNNIERKAIAKLIDNSNVLPVKCLGIYIDGLICGFSMFEVLDEDYGVVHFEKCFLEYRGIAHYMRNVIANRFQELGVSYINYEQDLGVTGLRKAKEMLHPLGYLKKYTIRPRNI